MGDRHPLRRGSVPCSVTAKDALRELAPDEACHLAQRELSRVHVIGQAVALAVRARKGEILHQHAVLHGQGRGEVAQAIRAEEGLGCVVHLRLRRRRSLLEVGRQAPVQHRATRSSQPGTDGHDQEVCGAEAEEEDEQR